MLALLVSNARSCHQITLGNLEKTWRLDKSSAVAYLDWVANLKMAIIEESAQLWLIAISFLISVVMLTYHVLASMSDIIHIGTDRSMAFLLSTDVKDTAQSRVSTIDKFCRVAILRVNLITHATTIAHGHAIENWRSCCTLWFITVHSFTLQLVFKWGLTVDNTLWPVSFARRWLSVTHFSHFLWRIENYNK